MLDLTSVDQVVEQGIAHGVCPGACYAVGMGDEVRVKAFGRFMYCPDSDAVTQDTLWDLASVSKVVGCTSAAMILFDEGKLKLDRPVAEVIPEFGVNGKEKITPRNLLLHDSGLPGWIPFHQQKELVTPASAMKQVHEAKLVYATGSKTLYSDLSMVMMCDLIQHLSDKRLDEFVGERLFGPLGMKDTMYRPTGEDRLRCAPTVEVDRWRERIGRRRERGVIRTSIYTCREKCTIRRRWRWEACRETRGCFRPGRTWRSSRSSCWPGGSMRGSS